MLEKLLTCTCLLSGFHRHMLLTGGGVAMGVWANKAMADSYAERDAIMYHYMSLHPDDFEKPSN